MADTLRPRLDRLQDLAKQLNATADRISKVVLGVESFLNEVCHLGLTAGVTFDHQSFDNDAGSSTKSLCYGRFGPKFRLFIEEEDEHDGRLVNREVVLWANASRDQKLAAYMVLPALLDKLIERVESTIVQIDDHTEVINGIIPARGKKKEATA